MEASPVVPVRKGRSNVVFGLATFLRPNSGRRRKSASKSFVFRQGMLAKAVRRRTRGLEHALADQHGRALLGLFVGCEVLG